MHLYIYTYKYIQGMYSKASNEYVHCTWCIMSQMQVCRRNLIKCIDGLGTTLGFLEEHTKSGYKNQH